MRMNFAHRRICIYFWYVAGSQGSTTLQMLNPAEGSVGLSQSTFNVLAKISRGVALFGPVGRDGVR